MLVKQVTTLDVLSGGRAWLGIGAAWFEREHIGTRCPVPAADANGSSVSRRRSRSRVQMWSDDNGPYKGKHYQLDETICSPHPSATPRPPIMIGGGGEKKTLRLVAKYADACNVAGNAEEIAHKFDVLKRHCDDVGRDYDEIERTVMTIAPPGDAAIDPAQALDRRRSPARDLLRTSGPQAGGDLVVQRRVRGPRQGLKRWASSPTT